MAVLLSVSPVIGINCRMLCRGYKSALLTRMVQTLKKVRNISVWGQSGPNKKLKLRQTF